MDSAGEAIGVNRGPQPPPRGGPRGQRVHRAAPSFTHPLSKGSGPCQKVMFLDIKFNIKTILNYKLA